MEWQQISAETDSSNHLHQESFRPTRWRTSRSYQEPAVRPRTPSPSESATRTPARLGPSLQREYHVKLIKYCCEDDVWCIALMVCCMMRCLPRYCSHRGIKNMVNFFHSTYTGAHQSPPCRWQKYAYHHKTERVQWHPFRDRQTNRQRNISRQITCKNNKSYEKEKHILAYRKETDCLKLARCQYALVLCSRCLSNSVTPSTSLAVSRSKYLENSTMPSSFVIKTLCSILWWYCNSVILTDRQGWVWLILTYFYWLSLTFIDFHWRFLTFCITLLWKQRLVPDSHFYCSLRIIINHSFLLLTWPRLWHATEPQQQSREASISTGRWRDEEEEEEVVFDWKRERSPMGAFPSHHSRSGFDKIFE